MKLLDTHTAMNGKHRIGRRTAFVTLVAGALTLCAPVWASASAVTSISVPKDFPTIQAAVDVAAPGATINIAPGTYTEEVVISEDLTVKGAGVGATIVQSPATLNPYAVKRRNGESLTAIVRVGRGAHVRMSGLTVSGPTPCGAVSGVNVVQAATLELVDAQVRDIVSPADCSGPQSARAVVFGLPPFMSIEGAAGSTAFGRVNNVAIDNYQETGLQAVGPVGVPPTNVTFSNNVITSRNPQRSTEQIGISVSRGASAQVTSNTVTGAVCTFGGCGGDPITQFQSGGILLSPAVAGISVSDNHISGGPTSASTSCLPPRTAAPSARTRCKTTDTSGSSSKTATAPPEKTPSAAGRSGSASLPTR